MIHKRTAPVRSFNNRYSILLPMASCKKTCQTYWEHPSTPSLAISIARSRFDMEQIFLAKSGECYGTGSYFSGNVRLVKVNNCRICLQELRRRLRNISNSALACSRLRDSRVPFSFPSSPLSESLEQANSA